jgi:hypothetical protein
MLHLEDCVSHFRFSEGSNERFFFLLRYLRDVEGLILYKGNPRSLWLPKKILIVVSNMALEAIISNNNTLIILKFKDSLFSMFTICD